MTGKIFKSEFLNVLKENIHRVLNNYYGIEVTHYRRTSDARDLYYDNITSGFTNLGTHLLHLSSQDYDTLRNEAVHFEEILPIEIFLDPTQDWKEHDEVVINLDTEGKTYTMRFEIVKLNASNKAGTTLYQIAQLAPVRDPRS